MSGTSLLNITMLHSGIELHKRTVIISTVDADGRVVRDVQLPTRRDAKSRNFTALESPTGAQRGVF